MGVRLMVEILDHCPEDATTGERLLLVALAEKADDGTRRVLWARGENPRDVLRRRTGVTDSGLAKILRRLTDRGLDPRVPVAIDRNGRPVYAFEGTAVEYVVPDLRACPLGNPLVDNSPESLPYGAPSDIEEVALEGTLSRTTGQALEPESLPSRAGHVPLSLDSPSAHASDLPPDQQRAVLELMSRGIAEVPAIGCVAAVVARKRPDDVARYVSRFTAEDVDRWAVGQSRPRAAAPQRLRCDEGVLIASDGSCCEACATRKQEASA